MKQLNGISILFSPIIRNYFQQPSRLLNLKAEIFFIKIFSPKKNPTAPLYYRLSLAQSADTLPYPDMTGLLQLGTLWSPRIHSPSLN